MDQKVSLRRIIGNVSGNMKLDSVSEDLEDYARWAADALYKIGSRNSFERKECEIEIMNFKADLPNGFMWPLAMKYKNKYLSVTKRNFRDFSKGRSVTTPAPEDQRFVGGNKVVNVPGVAQVERITFVGVFTAGETIVITVVSNDCGNVIPNTFTHIVQVGDTPSIIAAAFDAQFNAISNLPYTSQLSGDSINLQGISADVSFNITIGEDSVMGNVEQSTVQRRVPSKQNVDLIDQNKKTPRTTSENLANRDVTRLNTGLTSVNKGGLSYYGFNYEGFPSEEVFSIDNGCINFNALDGELIGIAYMAMDLDEEGWPLIYHLHEDAVTHYLQYMKISQRYWAGKGKESVYDRAEQKWFRLCAQARGDDEMPDATELEHLANVWNQLVPLPNKNHF